MDERADHGHNRAPPRVPAQEWPRWARIARFVPIALLAASVLVPAFVTQHSSGFFIIGFDSSDSGLFFWGFGLLLGPFVGIYHHWLLPVAALLNVAQETLFSLLLAVGGAVSLCYCHFCVLGLDSPGARIHFVLLLAASLSIFAVGAAMRFAKST
ncbi:MAG: hypothetical protein NTW87_08310 [Planctomycetota bacterium]|nr:hypothetical protein [Planctomycetota bacterium]